MSLLDHGFEFEDSIYLPQGNKLETISSTVSHARILSHALSSWEERLRKEDFEQQIKCKGDTSSEPERFAVCGDCYRWRKIIPSCGQRNCRRCQLKRSRMMMEKYIPALANIPTGYGRRWIAVALHGYRVPREWVGQNAFMFASDAREFLKKWFPKGGMIVIEHTWKPYEKEYYIHAHALVLGDYINNKYIRQDGLTERERFNDEWERGTWLSDMRYDPEGHPRTSAETIKAGLTYILKYVTKGVALEDEDLDQVKGMRYISTYGECYNMRVPSFRSICKFCKGRVGLCSLEDIEHIEKNRMSLGNEPLEIERVISWPERQPKISEEEQQKRDDELKAWWKRQWLEKSMPFGLHALSLWLYGLEGSVSWNDTDYRSRH